MRSRMNVIFALVLCGGCGASFAPPTSRAASTQAAIRSAQEVGAQSVPNAALHLKYSEEQAQQANAAMRNDENEKADWLLRRAQADAELALALTREQTAKVAADQSAAELQKTMSSTK